MIKTGKIRRGEWFIYDGGLKSRENLREARKAGVNVVTRLGINFVVHRFGKEFRKEDILSGVKAIKRTMLSTNLKGVFGKGRWETCF